MSDKLNNSRSKPEPTTEASTSVYGPGNAAVHVGGLDWNMVEAGILAETIAAVSAVGDAISFAQGRRGAYLSVTVLSGGERPKWEARDVQEMNGILVKIGNAARARLP